MLPSFTSWAQSFAQGTKLALAGSVNLLTLSNTSRAYIAGGAMVNQDPDSALRSGE